MDLFISRTRKVNSPLIRISFLIPGLSHQLLQSVLSLFQLLWIWASSQFINWDLGFWLRPQVILDSLRKHTLFEIIIMLVKFYASSEINLWIFILPTLLPLIQPASLFLSVSFLFETNWYEVTKTQQRHLSVFTQHISCLYPKCLTALSTYVFSWNGTRGNWNPVLHHQPHTIYIYIYNSRLRMSSWQMTECTAGGRVA